MIGLPHESLSTREYAFLPFRGTSLVIRGRRREREAQPNSSRNLKKPAVIQTSAPAPLLSQDAWRTLRMDRARLFCRRGLAATQGREKSVSTEQLQQKTATIMAQRTTCRPPLGSRRPIGSLPAAAGELQSFVRLRQPSLSGNYTVGS